MVSLVPYFSFGVELVPLMFECADSTSACFELIVSPYQREEKNEKHEDAGQTRERERDKRGRRTKSRGKRWEKDGREVRRGEVS